jgi:hypothetical protein
MPLNCVNVSAPLPIIALIYIAYLCKLTTFQPSARVLRLAACGLRLAACGILTLFSRKDKTVFRNKVVTVLRLTACGLRHYGLRLTACGLRNSYVVFTQDKTVFRKRISYVLAAAACGLRHCGLRLTACGLRSCINQA